MRGISLDCLTLPDVTPMELIRIAAETGYESVSLWVQAPVMYDPMLVDRSTGNDIARALADHRIAFSNLEVFNLNTDDPLEDYEAAIAFGASLGARSATAIDFGPPRPDMAERLAAFHAVCDRNGIATMIEPIAMGNVRTPRDGVDLIAAAGVDARIVIDCLHLMRSGAGIDGLKAIPAERIGHLQICDGPMSIEPDQLGTEATANRLYPGEGDFPIADIIAAAPLEATLGIETPNRVRQQRGVSPASRAREALEAARKVLERVKGRAR